MVNKSAPDVLLVEDNATDLELALRVLRKENMAERTETVRDGQEALDFLFASGDYQHRPRRESPRLVLLDLKMPKVDGLEVLRRMRCDELLRRVPVVVLSSSTDESDIRRSHAAGANSYIVKPVEYPRFSKAVSQILHYWLGLDRLNTSY